MDPSARATAREKLWLFAAESGPYRIGVKRTHKRTGRERHVRGRDQGCGSRRGRFGRPIAQGRGLCRGRGRRRQSPRRLGRHAGHLDRRDDVAVSPLRRDRGRLAVHRLSHHHHPAAALRPRRLRADAVLPVVSDGGAVSQPYPLVGRRRRHHRRGDPDLCHRGRRGVHRPRHHADPSRRRARRRVHRAAARGDAANHRLDRPVRGDGVHGLRLFRAVPAGAMDAPRLRRFAARRSSLHHARGYFRHSGRRVVLAHHPVHDLWRVPAAFRRRQVLHRFFHGAHGPQGQQRRPHRGAVLVPARWSVRLGRRHHRDDRRRRLSADAAGGVREERGRRPARRRRAGRHHLAAGARRRRLPDRRVPQDQLPRRDLDGDHPDLPLLPVAAVHGRARCQAVPRADRGLRAAAHAWRR